MSSSKNSEIQKLVRHELYYIPTADLCFLLGHVQFRVHRYFFERESAYFKNKLTTPVSPGAVRQGLNDSDPLVLEDVTADEFERFLWVFYNPKYSLYDATVDEWTGILKLAQKWGFREIKALAVRELEKKECGTINRIAVYQSYEVDRNLLIPHYAALVAREESLTLPEGLKLGMETTLVIASAREFVRATMAADGSRTPITPTVHGNELFDVIRQLFGIEAGSAPAQFTAEANGEIKPETNGSSTESAGTAQGDRTAAEGSKTNGDHTNGTNVNGLGEEDDDKEDPENDGAANNANANGDSSKGQSGGRGTKKGKGGNKRS